ncbi:hypothetical protein PINS_up010068 [Pythium insidiosum]|nr:hypothetical protein PINS_up010068 [Pythium insidiosum]
MMILEAIRRSMHDVNLAKEQADDDDHNDTREETHIEEDGDGETDTLRPARIVVEQSTQRRPSTNPFDEVGAPSAATTQATAASSQRRESWNPFSD